MIPETKDGWTLDIIEDLLQQGVFESDRFDFKESLPHPRDTESKQRLARTCAAFANSRGGFLIFGVKDDKGLDPGRRLVGVDHAEDFPGRFGNFPSSVVPSVEWDFRNPPLQLATGNVIHVVHMAPSRRGPHASEDDGRWWFCKRTSKGNEPMSFEEIRSAFLDYGRRRSEVAWLKAELGRIRDLAERLNVQVGPRQDELAVLLTRFDAGQLKSMLLTVFSTIGDNKVLLGNLHGLVEHCMRADAVLMPAAATALQPRDRSRSTRYDVSAVVRGLARQIVLAADHALKDLETV